MKNIIVTIILLAIYGSSYAQTIKIAEPVRFLALGDS